MERIDITSLKTLKMYFVKLFSMSLTWMRWFLPKLENVFVKKQIYAFVFLDRTVMQNISSTTHQKSTFPFPKVQTIPLNKIWYGNTQDLKTCFLWIKGSMRISRHQIREHETESVPTSHVSNHKDELDRNRELNPATRKRHNNWPAHTHTHTRTHKHTHSHDKTSHSGEDPSHSLKLRLLQFDNLLFDESEEGSVQMIPAVLFYIQTEHVRKQWRAFRTVIKPAGNILHSCPHTYVIYSSCSCFASVKQPQCH